MKNTLIALLGLGLLSCKPTNTAADIDMKKTGAQPDAQPTKSEKKKFTKVVKKPQEPALYDTPTERRLYASRATSSDFFGSDLHPFFAIDNDEKTGWGYYPPYKENSWLKLSISEVQGATQARIRIKAIETELGSPKQLTIKAIPGGQTATTELKQGSAWQELVLTLTAASTPKGGVINGLELLFGEAYEGKDSNDKEWRDYIEIAEVEVFVTGLTKENPAFEKEKLEQILTWKKARSLTAKITGTPLPMAKEYKAYIAENYPKDVVDLSYQEEEDYEPEYDFEPNELVYDNAFTVLQRYIPSQAKDVISRAQKALESEPTGWVPLNVASTALKPYVITPGTVGAIEPPIEVDSYEFGSDGFILPSFEFGTLALREQLEFKDLNVTKRPEGCYDTKQIFFWRRSEVSLNAPTEIIAESCISYESRGGAEEFRITQFLEYDDKGRLQLWVTPFTIEWFDWREVNQKSTLASVTRLTQHEITRFIEATASEPAFSDDKPWIVLASSKPLFDIEGEKISAALKGKLVAAGFTEAEIFDSRRAKNLSCCFTVVAAGRYKTKKEAQAAVKTAKNKGFETYTKKGW